VSNLSDLLPAGASGKQLTFTDSGSGITSKKPVVLNSDGTVTQVSGAAADIGGEQTFFSAASQVFSCYDETADRVVAISQFNGGGYSPYMVVGAQSGNSITWGTAFVIPYGAGGVGSQFNVCYDSTNGKTILVAQDQGNSNYITAISGTVDPGTNTISWGTKVVVESTTVAGVVGAVWDSAEEHLIVIYNSVSDGSTYYCKVGDASGTTLTFPSSHEQISSVVAGANAHLGYDSNAGKAVVFITNASTATIFYGKTITLSGNTPSFGADVSVLASGGVGAGMGFILSTFDTVNNTFVVVCYAQTLSGGTVYTNLVNTYTVSGTSGTAGTQTNNGTTGGANYYAAPAFDTVNQRSVIAFQGNNNYPSAFSVTLSGTTPNFTPVLGANTVLLTTARSSAVGSMVYNPDEQMFAYTYYTGYSLSFNLSETNLTAASFVGVADSAISASAAGSVIVQGGTVTGLTSASSTMSFGSPVNFDGAGWKQKNRMAYDTTNNRVVNIYEDNTGTGYVTAVVGTVSGTTTEWGTAVVVKSAVTNGVSIAYDTNAQKMVAYYNSGSAHYARVGTVSGSGTGATISFGAEVTVVAANADLCAIAYDANAQKVVVTVEESSVLKALVGTVAGTDITFGTAASFYSGDANNPGPQIAYDANAQKVVIQYTKTSDSYGYAIVGTIAGTDITFGTEASYSAATNRNNDISYDSTAQKLFLSFRDSSNNSTGIVGTIAGTDITFGAVATAITGGTQGEYSRCVYDPDNDITIVVGSVNSVGTVAAATISGTSASFSSPQTFNAFSTSEFGLTYDTTADKAVVVYAYFSGAGISPAVVITTATPFVTGSSYYVQTDGTFSTSAGDPSVKAGLAISTTSLLLNGDS